MSMIPPVTKFIADAERLYDDIRDASKRDALIIIASTMLKVYGEGGTGVLNEMQGEIQRAVAPRLLCSSAPKSIQ